MDERQRLKRQEPERAGPIRNWSTMYRRPEPAAARNPEEGPDPPTPPTGTSFGETVTSGVKLGYRVIDEQIRLGQRIAEQCNDRTYGSGAMASDFREVAERILGYYMDFGKLWF